MEKLTIVVTNKTKKCLIRTLGKLKTTISILDGGPAKPKNCSKVYLCTTKTITETIDWLNNTKAKIDALGTRRDKRPHLGKK